MSKKKKIIILAAVIAMVLLAFLGGQAYAKYITQVTGEGVAEVATWNFKVNGGTEQVENIDLVSTFDNETLLGHKIAPGTEGSFNIIVDGSGSDVGINYNINFTEKSAKPTNLKFIYDGNEYNTIEELESGLSGVINANDENKTRILNIGWKWKYQSGSNAEEILSNDLIDTKEAQEIQNYMFDVSVTGTQVAPQN